MKHTSAGIPDPCIRVKKGAGRVFLKNYFNPFGAFEVEVGTLLRKGRILPMKESEVKKLKKAKYQKVCLY